MAVAGAGLPRRVPIRWAGWGLLGLSILAGMLLVRLIRPPAPGAEPPVFAEVGTFELLDHAGRPVTAAALAGRFWVVDFIFTRCGTSCPLMTDAMLRLQAAWPEEIPVWFLSISVDPAFDRPGVLADYRRRHGIEAEDWLFLTGEREAVYSLVSGTFLLPVDPDPPAHLVTPEEPILHSTRFVLVDPEGRIRGYYEGLDPAGRERLLEDARRLAS